MLNIPDCVLVPREAYKYWPPQVWIKRGEGKKSMRFIFENQELTEFEKEKLSRLMELLKKTNLQGLSIPENWSQNHILRFCYGGKWNTKNSLKGLVSHLEWRKNLLSQGYKSLYPKVSSLLVRTIQDSGAFYIHGRDERYRPLLVMNITKIDFKKVSQT